MMSRHRGRKSWMKYLRFRGAVPLIILVIVWQIIGSERSITFPTPITWLQALRRLSNDSNLWGALGETAIAFFL